LREDKRLVARSWREGFYLLNRCVRGLLLTRELKNAVAVQFLPDFHVWLGKVTSHPLFWFSSKLQGRHDTVLTEECCGLGPDTPDLFDGQVSREQVNVPRLNRSQTGGLLPSRGDLGDDLVRGEPHRKGKSERCV